MKFLFWCFVLGQVAQQGPTLATVFQENGISTLDLSRADFKQRITSYAVSKPGPIFLAAYYDDFGSESLSNELQIVRFDIVKLKLTRTTLRGTPMHLSLLPENPIAIARQVPSDCLGSAVTVSEQRGLIAITTHINPSAGCTLVLNSDLSFRAAIGGFLVARSPRALLIETNTVHFAPTHAGGLLVFDLQSDSPTQVYPQPRDKRRQHFSALLRSHLPAASWCREHNNPCDPESFTTAFSNARFDSSRNAFGFYAVMSADGFGPEAEALIRPEIVHYTCELRGGKWHVSGGQF